MTTFQDILSRPSLFNDMNVLSPHYVPDTLPFRDAQIKEIMETVSSALKGQKPRNLFIYGKTGTGKTCCTKYVMDRFNSNSENNGKGGMMQYINCRIYNSRYRVLQKVMKQFVPELEKAGFGLPFLYEKMIEVASNGKQLVIVLDEIDMVKDLDDMIYTMTRANDEIKSGGGVSIVGISNKLSFKNELDPRSKSSLYENEIVFPPYSSTQLQQILLQRATHGFRPGVVSQSAINLASAITAQECGDARYALKLIAKAGELAEAAGKMQINDEDVEAARKKVDADIAAETIATLPYNHQVVLYAIAHLSQGGSKYARLDGVDEGFLFSGEIYEEYERTCRRLGKRARSSRWYKEYLTDLEMLGLIMTTPSGRGVRGHTTLVKLGHAPSEILTIISRGLNFSGETGTKE
ncbi:TPA: AAA family ATPase [Candidatus Micrarchaeota archaeon]|nr:AAA family ATPase [Candidatus Micrarchaeota archaeon]